MSAVGLVPVFSFGKRKDGEKVEKGGGGLRKARDGGGAQRGLTPYAHSALHRLGRPVSCR